MPIAEAPLNVGNPKQPAQSWYMLYSPNWVELAYDSE